MERYEMAVEWVCEAGEMLRRMCRDSLETVEKSGHQDIVTECDREIEQFLRQKIWERFPDDQIVGEEYTQRARCTSKSDQDTKGAVWFLDPIDGTTNFVNQRCGYAVSVGCIWDETPQFGIVLDVEGRKLYSAKAGCGAWLDGHRLHTAENVQVKDMLFMTPCVTDVFLGSYREKEKLARLALDVRAVRSIGSVALELCQVASGRVDLCIAMKSSPWDHNAARLILTEAGGEIRRLDGAPLPYYEDSTFLAGSSVHVVEQIIKEYM